MYVTETISRSKSGKVYKCVLLRESYREGKKVKNRTIAKLTGLPDAQIEALKLAFKHKDDLHLLGSLKDSVQLKKGQSVGAVYAVYELARRLGIEKALGGGRDGKLALWQVMARAISQGSRLSAVRMAQTHAAADVLGFERGFDENDLYGNLTWLSENQAEIEKRLFRLRRSSRGSDLFLYDVTSSYLEGNCNELSDWGYNRDNKRGKKQIVIGLLCDETGAPVSVQVFRGNTQDVKTFGDQVRKVSERFGCGRVTFVGDRGMIKSAGIAELKRSGFHYITAITKPQIESLLKSGVFQMELFDAELCEVMDGESRYILRRNPDRAEEMRESREDKKRSAANLATKKNSYLLEHGRAQVDAAIEEVSSKIERLGIAGWLKVRAWGRELKLEVDESALAQESKLDGCYVIKTDLPAEAAAKELVHAKYKDLADVEMGFRTMKTAHLEVRPVYVRKEKNTRGHVLVVMLAYLIIRELKICWAKLDVTVEEGLRELATLCSTEMSVRDRDGKSISSIVKIPTPCDILKKLLDAAEIHLPTALPHRYARVVTKRKLASRRKIR